ncbi:MAG: hypothetical protein WBE86_01185 [Candidatus Acidiferrales bacterium]
MVLRFVGGFSAAQGWFLTIGGALGYALYVDLRMQIQDREAFSPFWVCVRPNWYHLLRDHGIIQTDAETFWDEADLAWQQLEKQGERSSTDTYRVLRNNMMFTVLTRTSYGRLVYWNSRRTFHNKIDFDERIWEIKLDTPTFPSPGWSPDVFVEWGSRGCELGLEVDKEWWEKTCLADETKQLSKISIHAEYLTGRVRLVIATLPRAEFETYATGNAPASLGFDVRLKKLDKKLAQAGWKRKEMDAEWHLLGAPDCIEHKYFKVEHRSI